MKKILITGASGQDGQILSYKLSQENCYVIGLGKKRPLFDQLIPKHNYHFVEIDLTNFSELQNLLNLHRPDVIFNLASLSSVKASWQYPEVNFLINQDLPIYILDWIVQTAPNTKFIQASSSEIFGGLTESPQNEMTNLAPITPYGLAKANAHEYTIALRDQGITASTAILYNHESPLRDKTFITQKISMIAASYQLGRDITEIPIGNASATRDWGWAPDYVDAMLLIMNDMNANDKGVDYVISTGIKHSVMDLMNIAFDYVDFQGWQKLLIQNSDDHRKIDPSSLLGNSEKIEKNLGWVPRVDFSTIVQLMIKSEICNMSSHPSFEWLKI
jgi:GDPmannose 4,6-dehydratase